jgi:hypothetical protein
MGRSSQLCQPMGSGGQSLVAMTVMLSKSQHTEGSLMPHHADSLCGQIESSIWATSLHSVFPKIRNIVVVWVEDCEVEWWGGGVTQCQDLLC